MRSPSSSAQQARQALADRLRDIRSVAGLSGRDLAGRVGWTASKVSKIEHAKQPPTPEDVRKWCHHCGAGDQVDDLVASLRAVEGMWIEWHQLERSGIARAQRSADALFENSRKFRSYDAWLIPGLLQTAPYTTALLEAVADRRNLPRDDIAEAVGIRMERQQILYEAGRTFAVVIEEPVLRYRIGGPDVMAAQLGHLLAAGVLPSVSLGIIPMSATRTLRAFEGFWIFDNRQVNVELISGWLSVTHPREIAMYVKTFTTLKELAVYGQEARALIAQAIAALD